MALQMTTTYNDVLMTDAYHKVLKVSGNKDRLEVTISVRATPTSPTMYALSFQIPGADLVHDGSALDKNYTEQAYAWMKANTFDSNGTTHDYSTALDV